MAGMKHDSTGRKKRLSQFFYIISLVFLLFGLVNLAWRVWPTPTDAVTFTIPSGVLPGAPADRTYASLADYVLEVTWPRWLRVGQTGTIQMTLGPAVTDEGAFESTNAQVVLVEPSFVGLVIEPPGRTQTTLAPGQNLDLTWELDGVVKGTFPGQIILAFGFFDETLGELVQVPVVVVDTSVQVTALWGQGGGLALWFGIIGLVLWGLLFLAGRLVKVKN